VAESEIIAEKAVKYLNENGVGTRPFFWCMHEQPVFKEMGLFLDEKYPVAEKLARRGFYIPSGLGLEDKQIDYVIRRINDLMKLL
jgi:perosamine synthetase